MSVEDYVKREFKTTLEVYVTDGFHRGGTFLVDVPEIITPKRTTEIKIEENSLSLSDTMRPYNGPDMTVEQFLNGYLATDVKELKKAITGLSSDAKTRKTVLAGKMFADNYDCYFAQEFNVGREVIEHYILNQGRKYATEE